MKVFSKLNLKKTPATHIQTPVLTYFSLSLLVLSLFVLLTACDDRKATTSITTRAATGSEPAIVNSTLAPPASQTGTLPTVNRPVYPNSQPESPSQTSPNPYETFTSEVADQPIITFSPEIVAIGQSVEISGKGYPANTRLNI